jgi:hypothetical protein
LFFSYRRHDLERARRLLDVLARTGIRVWRDERQIAEQDSISREIRQAIADCKAFVSFYSRTYPLSHACQQELTAAWLAAQELDGTANRRVWIVNPETNRDHLPELLARCHRAAGQEPKRANTHRLFVHHDRSSQENHA